MHNAFTLAVAFGLMCFGYWRFAHFMNSLPAKATPQGDRRSEPIAWIAAINGQFGIFAVAQSFGVLFAGVLVLFGPFVVLILG